VETVAGEPKVERMTALPHPAGAKEKT